jgi:hypothetical protein
MLKQGIITASLALTVGAAAVAAMGSTVQDDMPQATAEHREILAGVGTWEGTVKGFWPGAPETPTPAKETVEAIGEFWIQSRFESYFETPMGDMPFVGVGVSGFDPATGKYVGTWADSSMPYLSVMEGEKDASGNLVMRWKAPDMATGEIGPQHSVLKVSGDSYTMDFFSGEGEGQKVMTISMKRKGGGMPARTR